MLSCEQRIFVDGGKGGSIRIHSAIPTLPLLDPDAARSRAVRRNASMPMVLRSGVIFTPDSPAELGGCHLAVFLMCFLAGLISLTAMATPPLTASMAPATITPHLKSPVALSC